jgi:transcriptional regulator with XRE-family HTH domain
MMPHRVRPLLQQPRRNFIRDWRTAASLSQDALVERVRERLATFSKSTLSRIENGRQPYSQPILEALAWALGCEPGDLIMRQPDSPVWTMADNLHPAIPEIVAYLRHLSTEEQEQIARIVKTFRRSG